MSELTVNWQRELSAARFQKESRAVKQPAAGEVRGAEKTAKAAQGPISAGLQRAIAALDQNASGNQSVRQQLLTQEGTLAEAQDILERMAGLARQAMEGGELGELQPELEELLNKLEQVLENTSGAGTALTEEDLRVFESLADDLSAFLAPGASRDDLLDGLRQLLSENIPLDQALQQLLAGGLLPEDALLELLSGDTAMDLLLNALTAAPPLDEAALEAVLPAERFGGLEAAGLALSEVAFDPAADTVRVGGEEPVILRGQSQAGEVPAPALAADGPVQQAAPPAASAPSILLSGSGVVTLKGVDSPAMTVDTPEARVSSRGENTLGELRMNSGTSLTLEGDGQLKIGGVRGDASNTVKVSGGAVSVKDGAMGDVNVVVESAASLAARPQAVVTPAGKPAEPFDILWKSMLSGWREIDAVAVDGKAVQMALYNDPGRADQLRLWLDRGDRPLQDAPVRAVTVRGKDESGQARTRTVWLRWDEGAQTFQSVVMYPDPFTVVGGSQGVDWTYDHETQALRILTDQVTHISGGAGLDAEGRPFCGRLELENNLGFTELTLGGVDCRVSAGRAFDLGLGNDVTLRLQDGSRNYFAGGSGFAGLSLGDGTSLTIDRAEPEGAGAAEQAGAEAETDEVLDALLSGSLDAVLNSGLDMVLNAGYIGGDEEEPPEEPAEEVPGPAASAVPRLPAGTLAASGRDGGAGIGRDRGGSWDRTSRIVIRGGVIAASGTGGGAGIGAGKYRFMGDVVITGGHITASGGAGGAGIGGALGAPVGNITIEGGVISASADYHAAAIGAGVEGACGDILIGGNVRIVKAEGGDPESSIGGCRFGKCGEVRLLEGADTGGVSAGSGTPGGAPLYVSSSLPRFEITPRMLRLKNLDLQTFESALSAEGKIGAANKYVSLVRDVYYALSGQTDPASGGRPVRDLGTAAELLKGAKGPILNGAPDAFTSGDARAAERLLDLKTPLA